MPHVCLVIEGAYPYITGGVSAWCHQLISEIKDVDFSLLTILPASYRGKDYKYELPDNVKNIHEVWLDTDYFEKKSSSSRKRQRTGLFQEIIKFHTSMRLKNYGTFKLILKALSEDNNAFCLNDLTRSREAIGSLFALYKNSWNTSGFMRYFWTWKSTHLPLLRIMHCPLPMADLYHAVSTGYAGLLSAVAKLKYNIPFVLTEHGIYAMEREDELKSSRFVLPDQKDFWIRFFHGLCRISYSFADKIVTLFRGNLFIEVSNNANVDRIEIIPNGVDIDFYSSLKKVPSETRIRVGIVARVVPIKDIKTFIRAVAMVKKKVPEAEFYIVGPTDEDEDYFKECQALADELKLNNELTFTGKVNMPEFYPKLDILVLTSSREAQPLVLLEAMGAGIPCISTDVGACREMLADVGFITRPGKPEETAEAITTLCQNKRLREELIIKGREKVRLNYDVKDVIESYRDIYHKFSHQMKAVQMGRYWPG